MCKKDKDLTSFIQYSNRLYHEKCKDCEASAKEKIKTKECQSCGKPKAMQLFNQFPTGAYHKKCKACEKKAQK